MLKSAKNSVWTESNSICSEASDIEDQRGWRDLSSSDYEIARTLAQDKKDKKKKEKRKREINNPELREKRLKKEEDHRIKIQI